ncbi:MAG TPA: tripartite tricarboxylate transporter substrate binding protein [Caldimonas sp.]|nr:tripartite tricarboxylate transporter substrate binding protein [Caldimonas sp.]HEX2539748.1 tripartite tricarboxylate transporter substrate binding protein [Caldimonas sp.]
MNRASTAFRTLRRDVVSRAVRRRLAGALLAVLVAGLPPASAAQTATPSWPAKPIRLVSPFNPGGAIDVLNRVIAEKLAQRLGQPVVVDAQPGANTIKGADLVAKAPPDGYTFMITTMSTHVNNTVLFNKLPFDPARDFAPITQVSLGSVLLTAPGNAPYSDLRGFVAWAKAQNRPISYGSWGVGSSANVYGEILAKDHGMSLTHVPYKGEQPAITDVIGGSLDVTFASPVGAKPQVQAGKLKALGMTGPARSAAMPEVPTFAEQGFKGFELPIWVAAYAPAGTPRPIIERLQKEIAAVIRLPDVMPKMVDQGQTPLGNTPEEFAAAFARDAPSWINYIRASGAKPE